MDYLSFALTKGRLTDNTMELFSKIGIVCDDMNRKSRKLVFTDKELGYKFFLAKAGDVPTYVEYGAADLGVAGKDALLEQKRNLCEIADLGFGKCKIVVAGASQMKSKLGRYNGLRVATKYPCIATDYFYKKLHQTVEIIKLDGSVELGAIVGVADVIVDIVETGSTLKDNGLEILDEICPISARLVVNWVSMKMKSEKILPIIEQIKRITE